MNKTETFGLPGFDLEKALRTGKAVTRDGREVTGIERSFTGAGIWGILAGANTYFDLLGRYNPGFPVPTGRAERGDEGGPGETCTPPFLRTGRNRIRSADSGPMVRGGRCCLRSPSQVPNEEINPNPMIKIEIKNRWTGSIIFEYSKKNNTIKDTVIEAIKSKANLRWADLSEANLSKADLRWADLRWADLRWADLSEANLSEADLSKANLRWANLSEADLSKANLRWADLRWADLSKANLRWADLSEANLSEADLSVIKNDFFAKLLVLKHEVPAFKAKLIAGEIDGSCYEGACCCFVGTFANIKGIKYTSCAVLPDSDSPTERWFMAIRPGHTPEKSQVAKITLEWIEEFESLIATPPTVEN